MADIQMLDELFAAMDANGDGAVSKHELVEFLRLHKPKHGPWASLAKLQTHFGVANLVSIDRAAFGEAFKRAGAVGLDPAMFEFPFLSALAASCSTGELKLMYFPIAGRGELARLTAVAGGLGMMTESFPGPAKWKAEAGFFGSIPVLEHGEFKLCQSLAISSYINSIAPKFAGLTPQQKAVDAMFAATLEDAIVGCAKVVFGDHSTANEIIPAVFDKFCSVLEGLVPDAGFIHGTDFPCQADLAVLTLLRAKMPFNRAIELMTDAAYDTSKWTKLTALAERVEAVPAVSDYLAATTYMGTSF